MVSLQNKLQSCTQKIWVLMTIKQNFLSTDSVIFNIIKFQKQGTQLHNLNDGPDLHPI